ncbi:MAG: MoaD/ThiS family protein [Promethearchaeia archaeon]
MVLIIKFFGDLKEKIDDYKSSVGFPTIVELNENDIEFVADILKRFSISESKISHIFVNHRYSGLKKRVKAGDVIAFFPKKMGLLYKWYFIKEEDNE